MNDKQLNALQIINSGGYYWGAGLTIEEILFKDENGKCLLEYAIEKGVCAFLSEVCNNSIEVLEILEENNKMYTISFLKFNEDLLFSDYNGQLLIEHLIEIDECNSDNIENIANHYEIVDILIKNKSHLLSYVSEGVITHLITKNDEGIYNIEKYIDNNSMLDKVINKINDPIVIINLYNKYKNLKILKNINENVATFKLPGDITLFEYLIDRNVEMKLCNNVPCNKELIDVLIKNNKIDMLSKIKEDVLRKKIDGDKTVLQYLFENCDIHKLDSVISDEETIKLLKDLGRLNDIEFEVNGYRLNYKCNILSNNETLLEYLVRNRVHFKLAYGIEKDAYSKLFELNYLEGLPENISLNDFSDSNQLENYIIKVKNGEIKANLNDISIYSASIEQRALFYITLAKYDMHMYVKELEEEKLLEHDEGKMLLDELLKLDKDLTLKLLSKEKYNPKIATILKTYGVDVEHYNVGKIEDPIKDYRSSYESTLSMGPILSEGESLLLELESLFKNDGKSSPEVIDVLISGYRNGLIQFYDVCVSEIANLVSVKKNVPEFVYIRDDEHGFFRPLTNEIHSSLSLETVMHETGHALHGFLMNTSTPDGYEELKQKLREDPATLERLISFREETSKISKLASAKAESIIDNVGISLEKENADFLLSDLNEKREQLKEVLSYIDIDDETLDQILGGMYTVDQYNEHKKRIIFRELEDGIIRNDYPVYTDISDIFDSIYKGKFLSGLLVGSDGSKISGWYGHGIPYYSEDSHGFDELVAEFSALIKLPNPSENLDILRKYIGEEMYNMISEYYYNNIVKNTYGVNLEENASFVIDTEHAKSL